MIYCWSHKEPSVKNNQKPKPQSSHMISNKQHPGELHVTQNEQKVNKQIEIDLIIRTEYLDDRHDDLDDQNYIRHPAIGQTQYPFCDQRHYKH